MFSIKRIFQPDYEHYEGVRPINIYLLRLLFLLVVVFVATDSWSSILKHEGQWDHVKAAAVCMWAAYSVLSIFALINPLKWLPIVMFEIREPQEADEIRWRGSRVVSYRRLYSKGGQLV